MNKKFSCIIAAYNEADRIGKVLEVATKHPLLDEVIVVNDGSLDSTATIVEGYQARLIDLPQNHGKGFAVATGVYASKNEFILLLDADLIGLTEEGITSLLEPVISGQADMSISLRKNSLLIYRLIGLDFVSGERVFDKKFIEPHLEFISKLPGFGLEVFLNKQIILNKLKIKVVYLSTLISPRKSMKTNFFRGAYADILMIGHILKVISVFELVNQNLKMLAQRV
jgi:glycosyltransferase involved in cell wall biosynthesis